MSYIIEKVKHSELDARFTQASCVVSECLDPVKVDHIHTVMKNGKLIQNLESVTRTKHESHKLRMAIHNLEGVIKELKHLKEGVEN